jgi:glyoxylase-like metal-dependent hydrolase (beta-lactamase superfamily II)
MTWREVSDRVFVRRHESFDLNVGLIVGDGACLVIDTREHLAAGREVAAAVREVSAAPWTVVNTHAHFDHFLGNAAFEPADIWALDRALEVIDRFGDVQRRVMIGLARRYDRAELALGLDQTSIAPPNHTFAAPRTVLDIGGRAVTLQHLGRGHTDNDIVLTIEDSPVVFAGDLVEEGAPPGFDDAFPIEWGTTLDALLELTSGPVVPGHGAVVDEAYVREQRELHARVAAAARGYGTTVAGLPDEVAEVALERARAELADSLTDPTPDELLARFGLT